MTLAGRLAIAAAVSCAVALIGAYVAAYGFGIQSATHPAVLACFALMGAAFVLLAAAVVAEMTGHGLTR